MEIKKLSLIHLEIGMKLFEGSNFSKIVAVYLASPAVLRAYKNNGDVALTSLLEQAEELDADEAATIVNFFAQAAKSFLKIMSDQDPISNT